MEQSALAYRPRLKRDVGTLLPPQELLVMSLSLLYFAVLVIFAFALNSERIQYFFLDDSFFYIKVAHNFNQGLGFTFDGINTTTGFHPLYMAVLLAFDRLIPLK